MLTRAVSAAPSEKAIDAIFARFDQCHYPGAAVGLAIHGKPVYRKAFGLANMELPIVLSPAVKMRIASISKHFTCLAYLLLCEEGEASVDDPIGRYVPELHPITHRVTLRQLMGNISGLHDSHEIKCQLSGTRSHATSLALLSLYRGLNEVNAPPGTAWIYNNGGFLILTAVIERIASQSLEEFLRGRVFDPAGLYSTALCRRDDEFVLGSAAAHALSFSGRHQKPSFFGMHWAGEGGVVSTVDDMLRWLAHMDAPIIGTPATWREMITAQRLANGTSTGYGLGLITHSYRGVETIFHPGGGEGCSAQMIKVPAAGLDLVVLVNRDDVHAMELADRVLDTCLFGLAPAERPFTGPFSTGVFRSPTSGRVIELLERAGQQIVSIDGLELAAMPDEHGVFWPAGIWRYYKQGVSVLRGDRPTPSSIRLSDFGNVEELLRQDPPSKDESRNVLGSYRSDSTGTDATIWMSASGPMLSTTGVFGSVSYPLQCLAPGIWRARSPECWYYGGILSFDRSTSAFRFFSSLRRMLGLRFRRVADGAGHYHPRRLGPVTDAPTYDGS